MGWSKDNGTVAKRNADYAKAQGDVAKQEASNLAELKTDAELAAENASTAAENANNAKSNADNAASEANTQANYAKNEGDRAKAEADRLAGTDVSVLDNKIQQVTTQLAQNTQQVIDTNDDAFYGGVTYNRDIKPSLLIIDDDAFPKVYELLKPICEEFGVPITTAVIPHRVGHPSYVNSCMTLEQIRECVDAGMEVVSHTMTHKRMNDITEEEVHYECGASKRWLHEHGFATNILVYPFGSANTTVQNIASKYYRASFHIDSGLGGVLQPPLNQNGIRRFNYNSDDGTNNVQGVKDKIDEAKATNGLLVVMMHCHYNGFSAEGVREFVQHAIAQGVEIITAKKAIERFGNIIDTPDLQISAEGKVTKIPQTYLTSSRFTAESHVDSFPDNTVTDVVLSGSNTTGSPSGVSGTLITHKYNGREGAYQEWINSGTLNRFKRKSGSNANGWGDWVSEQSTTTARNRSWDYGTINAKSCVRKSLTSTSLFGNDTKLIFSRLAGVLPEGLIASQLEINTTEGKAYYTICNITDNPIVAGTITFREFEVNVV